MTKRLQVLFDDSELEQIQLAARDRRMTTAEWVRQSLRTARASDMATDARTKLESIRAAAEHSFPVADIDAMLAEIERGYLGDDPGRHLP